MHRAFTGLIGLTTYALTLLAMAALVAFTAPFGWPWGVNHGPTGPWDLAVTMDVALLALFGLQHSLMARRRVKAWLARACPPALERSTYLLATCAALAALMLLWRPLPQPVLWQAEAPAAVGALGLLWGLGWGLAAWSTFLLDHAELFGLRQSLGWARPNDSANLRTPGIYRWVRHPLYLGMLIGLWATPRMTAGHALLAGGLSVYVALGMALEERDLIAHFGEAYRRYRQQAGALWPRLGTRRDISH
ncbi:methyltransferase family protein [Roseateles sp. BYS87W]|uniref:Methyltransferase family protein n=1 Tax=Pelomonas baiyunensis TaxID=3299026 RepID=A0ABW7GYW0_9BURK